MKTQLTYGDGGERYRAPFDLPDAIQCIADDVKEAVRNGRAVVSFIVEDETGKLLLAFDREGLDVTE